MLESISQNKSIRNLINALALATIAFLPACADECKLKSNGNGEVAKSAERVLGLCRSINETYFLCIHADTTSSEDYLTIYCDEEDVSRNGERSDLAQSVHDVFYYNDDVVCRQAKIGENIRVVCD